MLQNFRKHLEQILKYKVAKCLAKIRPKLSICPNSEILRSFHLCHFCLSINLHHTRKS